MAISRTLVQNYRQHKFLVSTPNRNFCWTRRGPKLASALDRRSVATWRADEQGLADCGLFAHTDFQVDTNHNFMILGFFKVFLMCFLSSEYVICCWIHHHISHQKLHGILRSENPRCPSASDVWCSAWRWVRHDDDDDDVLFDLLMFWNSSNIFQTNVLYKLYCSILTYFWFNDNNVFWKRPGGHPGGAQHSHWLGGEPPELRPPALKWNDLRERLVWGKKNGRMFKKIQKWVSVHFDILFIFRRMSENIENISFVVTRTHVPSIILLYPVDVDMCFPCAL